jgi:hypothetical protein
MSQKSRNKGKRGEREAAKVLSKILGMKLSRGVQYKGTPNSPDVTGLEDIGLHPEVKRDERTISTTMYKALQQAENESGSHTPFLISRRNNKEWIIALKLEHLMEFCKSINEAEKKRK